MLSVIDFRPILLILDVWYKRAQGATQTSHCHIQLWLQTFYTFITHLAGNAYESVFLTIVTFDEM